MKKVLSLLLFIFTSSLFLGFSHVNKDDHPFFNNRYEPSSIPDTMPQHPLEKFKGEWVLKDNI